MLNRLPALAALTLAASLAAAANAAPIMFATFTEPAASQGLHFTNNGGTSASFSASTPVDFEFTAPTGLPTTDHAATLTITVGIGPQAITPATTAGALIDQHLGVLSTLAITENGTGLNLLTVQFNGDILGISGSQNASISGDQLTGNIVTYSSNFLTFANTPSNSFNLGLATLSPTLSVGPGGFLNSFIANIDGQFSADNVSGGGSPEPASLGILGLGAAALLTRRRYA
jgi:hypothetical protein